VRKHVSKPPSRLRCGVARGQIVAVGNGHDFVGPSLNIASRLQKLSSLSFAVSRRGIDLSKIKRFVLKRVELQGIGDQELVYVLKSEFNKLPLKGRKLFKEP
jgi:class 3 adenylate cyclase